MSEEPIRKERIRSLVEVVHAVLLSLEDFAPAGQTAMRDNWGRVVTGVQERLSGAVDWSGGQAGYAPAPLPAENVDPIDFYEPPVVAAPPPPPVASGSESPGESGGSVGLGSIDLFLEQSANEPSPFPAEQGEASPPPWAPTAPSNQDAVPPLDDQGAIPFPGGPDPIGAPAGGAQESLQREVEQLRAENADLRRQLRSQPAAAGFAPASGLTPDQVLVALGVSGAPPGAEAGLIDQVQRVGAYLDGTHRNLNHVFGKLKLSVQLPTFADSLSHSLSSGQDIHSYLECLRDCWKILVGGTWNSLRGWCERLESSLNPQEIDRISRQQRMKPWDLYVDLYKRMALYNNLIEFLRTKIKAQVRERQPQLLHE